MTAVAASHLYVHVPFCAHRCGYCDFVTVTGNEHLQARYVDALLDRDRHGHPPPIQTVFIGGGTPTLLADELLARLLAGVPPEPMRSRSSATPRQSPRQRLKY